MAGHARHFCSGSAVYPDEAEEQDGGESEDTDVEFAVAAADEFDDGVANEAEGDAVGDGVGQRDGEEGDGDGRSFGEVVPVNFAHGVHHQYGDVENGAGGGVARYHLCERREEGGEEEEDANDDRH